VSLRGLLLQITVRFHQSLSAKKFVSAEESVNHGRMCVAEVFLGSPSHVARKVGEGLRAIRSGRGTGRAIIAPAANFEESLHSLKNRSLSGLTIFLLQKLQLKDFHHYYAVDKRHRGRMNMKKIEVNPITKRNRRSFLKRESLPQEQQPQAPGS